MMILALEQCRINPMVRLGEDPGVLTDLGRRYKKNRKKPLCVPGHTVEVKLLWTQLCMRMSKYIRTSMWNFLKFFQKLLSAYIFINCTNLSKFVKFVKIVFNAYLNFIKLSNISEIFWQSRTKFSVFCIWRLVFQDGSSSSERKMRY